MALYPYIEAIGAGRIGLSTFGVVVLTTTAGMVRRTRAAAGSLIAYMMADLRATTDELFAAGATYSGSARRKGRQQTN